MVDGDVLIEGEGWTKTKGWAKGMVKRSARQDGTTRVDRSQLRLNGRKLRLVNSQEQDIYSVSLEGLRFKN